VLLDLGGVSFIDSGGIATLMSIHREMEVSLRRLEVRSAQGHVLRVLEMTGASRLLSMT
jgi:anti-anti-sigma factor